MPKHVFRSCLEDCREDDHCRQMGNCTYDNLGCCRVCNGAEASLPTDCPGVSMFPATENMVQEGHLDFTDTKGWHKKLVPLTTEEMEALVAPLRQV